MNIQNTQGIGAAVTADGAARIGGQNLGEGLILQNFIKHGKVGVAAQNLVRGMLFG